MTKQHYRPDWEASKQRKLLIGLMFTIVIGTFVSVYYAQSMREAIGQTAHIIFSLVVNITVVVAIGKLTVQLYKTYTDAQTYRTWIRDLQHSAQIGPIPDDQYALWELQWRLTDLTLRNAEQDDQAINIIRAACETSAKHEDGRVWITLDAFESALSDIERQTATVGERFRAGKVKYRIQALRNNP